MYKQSKLQGHASYTSLETQEGATDGHLAVKRYLNTRQGIKITPTGERMKGALYFFPNRAYFYCQLIKIFVIVTNRQSPSSFLSLT